MLIAFMEITIVAKWYGLVKNTDAYPLTYVHCNYISLGYEYLQR